VELLSPGPAAAVASTDEALVQHAQANAHAVTSLAVTWPTATKAGTCLVAIVSQGGFAGTITTAQSGWVQGPSILNGSGPQIDIWYNKNNVGGLTSTSFSNSSGAIDMDVKLPEWSNVDVVVPLGLSKTNLGNSATVLIDTAPAITDQVGEVIIAAANVGGTNTSIALPSGWTALDSNVGDATHIEVAAWYRPNVTGSATFSSALGAGTWWAAALISLRKTGGGYYAVPLIRKVASAFVEDHGGDPSGAQSSDTALLDLAGNQVGTATRSVRCLVQDGNYKFTTLAATTILKAMHLEGGRGPNAVIWDFSGAPNTAGGIVPCVTFSRNGSDKFSGGFSGISWKGQTVYSNGWGLTETANKFSGPSLDGGQYARDFWINNFNKGLVIDTDIGHVDMRRGTIGQCFDSVAVLNDNADNVAKWLILDGAARSNVWSPATLGGRTSTGCQLNAFLWERCHFSFAPVAFWKDAGGLGGPWLADVWIVFSAYENLGNMFFYDAGYISAPATIDGLQWLDNETRNCWNAAVQLAALPNDYTFVFGPFASPKSIFRPLGVLPAGKQGKFYTSSYNGSVRVDIIDTPADNGSTNTWDSPSIYSPSPGNAQAAAGIRIIRNRQQLAANGPGVQISYVAGSFTHQIPIGNPPAAVSVSLANHYAGPPTSWDPHVPIPASPSAIADGGAGNLAAATYLYRLRICHNILYGTNTAALGTPTPQTVGFALGASKKITMTIPVYNIPIGSTAIYGRKIERSSDGGTTWGEVTGQGANANLSVDNVATTLTDNVAAPGAALPSNGDTTEGSGCILNFRGFGNVTTAIPITGTLQHLAES
jgi:hypothetical protein